MKIFKILTLFIGFFVLFSCVFNNKEANESETSDIQTLEKIENFGIVIHGGAGTILKEKEMHYSLQHLK